MPLLPDACGDSGAKFSCVLAGEVADLATVDLHHDRVLVMGVGRLGNQLSHALEKSVLVRFPAAGGTDCRLIVGLANHVDPLLGGDLGGCPVRSSAFAVSPSQPLE